MSPAVHVGQPISDAFMASPLSLLLSPPDSRLLSDRGQQVCTVVVFYPVCHFFILSVQFEFTQMSTLTETGLFMSSTCC